MINPNKMAAFTGGKQNDEGSAGRKFGNKGKNSGQQQGNKGKQQQGKTGKGNEPVDLSQYANGKYADLAPALEENAPLIEEMAVSAGLDAEAIGNGEGVDEETKSLVDDDFEGFDEDFRDNLRILSDAEKEDLQTLGDHLERNGLVEDKVSVVAWLTVLSRDVLDNSKLSASSDTDDSDSEDETDSEDEDDEYEEYGD